jgi:NAD(P) transhydrogenase subunit beta
MSIGITTVAYIGASILFILSLGGLSNQETARRGNIYGMVGMTIAIVATIAATQIEDYTILGLAVIVGAAVGIFVASRVEMTQMPQLVAILHSFVGLAAVLVGIASYVDPNSAYEGVEKTIHEVEIFLGVFIGAITFTGSVIAFGKLQGSIAGKPLLLPARHWLNLAGIIGSLWLGYEFLVAPDHAVGLKPLLIMTAIACLIGIHLVMAIGGGGNGLHARERPFDCRWCTGWFVWRDPKLYYVSRDESKFRKRDFGWFWHVWWHRRGGHRAGRGGTDLGRRNGGYAV